MTCPHHIWNLADGLQCTGVGEPHSHVFIASQLPDLHDKSEAAAEEARG